jgi:hypothetical protein
MNNGDMSIGIQSIKLSSKDQDYDKMRIHYKIHENSTKYCSSQITFPEFQN